MTKRSEPPPITDRDKLQRFLLDTWLRDANLAIAQGAPPAMVALTMCATAVNIWLDVAPSAEVASALGKLADRCQDAANVPERAN